MWDYVTTADSFVAIINRAVPYYVAAVAVAIGFKMSLFNIGVDGQYRLAALFAAAAGAALDLPAPLQISAILLVAMVVGGAYAAIPGVLEGHAGRQRGRLDDHVELHRHRHHGLPAGQLLPERRGRRSRPRPSHCHASGQLPPMNGFLEKFGYRPPGAR